MKDTGRGTVAGAQAHKDLGAGNLTFGHAFCQRQVLSAYCMAGPELAAGVAVVYAGL